MPVMEKFYSSKEVAELLDLTEGRICQLCRWNREKGREIGRKFGNSWMLTDLDIERIRLLPDRRKNSDDSDNL